MILDLVKQAVQIKITCKNPSPIISEGEFCYACAYALRKLDLEKMLEQTVGIERVEELQAWLIPLLEERKQFPAYHIILNKIFQLPEQKSARDGKGGFLLAILMI